MDMLEKVARAIAEAMEGGGFLWPDVAHAALEAMREPTEEMLIAGIESRDSGAGGTISEIWRAMIDAVLKNNPCPD
jgi:hypothetical protein